MGWRSTKVDHPLAAERVRNMKRRMLTRLALYVLQAVLWSGAMLMGLAILGGMAYLRDASKHAYADVQPEIFTILKNEIILAGLGATFLFWIGTVRTYMARNRDAEQGSYPISQPSLKALKQPRQARFQTLGDLLKIHE